MDDARRIWRGEEPLQKTFWLYGALPFIIFGLADYMIRQELPPVVSPGLAIGLLVFYAMTVAYSGFAIGAVWRSAGNYNGPRLWLILARLWAILGVMQIAGTIGGLAAS